MAALNLSDIEDSNSFYRKDLYWGTYILYGLEMGVDRFFLNKDRKGKWDATCRSGQEHFRLYIPTDIITDVKSSLLSLFEQDALWHYTSGNDSIGHRAAIIHHEIVNMWLWQAQEDPDNLMVHLIYNKDAVKELAKTVIKSTNKDTE